MDNLGWDGSQATRSTSTALWSSYERPMEEASNLRADESIQMFQRTQQTSDRANRAANYGSFLSWGELSPLDFLNSRPSINNQHKYHEILAGGSTDNFHVLEHQESQSKRTYSSLYCPFSSATNSIPDTSADDDNRVSESFSKSRKLLKFGSGTILSSGDSENIASSERIKGMFNDHLEETVSKSFSDHYFNESCKRILDRKPICAERSRNELKLFSDCSSAQVQGGLQVITERNTTKVKTARPDKPQISSNISFQNPNSSPSSSIDQETTEQMREMIYQAAAFRPVHMGLEAVDKPKRRNVKISSNPQAVVARQRREKISEKIRILQNLVPGGSKMDIASMLDEAANYLKFLRSKVKALESFGHRFNHDTPPETSKFVFSSLPSSKQSFSL